MLSKLDFGDFAAETDSIRYADELFVHTRQHKAFNLPQHRIIFGRKGAGKTALVQHISSRHRNDYPHLLPIDADSIRFKPMTQKFSEIYEYIGGAIELRKSFANIWEHSILTSCMLKLIKSIDTTYGDGAIIFNYLKKTKLLRKRIYDLLLDSLDNLFKIALGKVGQSTSALIRAIDNFPTDNTDFEDAKVALSKLINYGHSFLITFDKIDTYFEIEPCKYRAERIERESLRYFMAGLVQAVYNISVDKYFRDNLQFKIFLPLDRYNSVKSRDWDKIKKFVYKINWTHEELVEFIARRIAYSLDIRDSKGYLKISKSSTWHKIFGRTITNKTVNNIPEDIDRYFIRHTQYKPRDLQYFCAKAKEIALTYDGYSYLPMDTKVIRLAIKQMTSELVDNFFLEYQYEFPYIKKIINHFRGHQNIFNYSEGSDSLWQTVTNFVKKEKLNLEMDALIRTMYNMGFLGGMTLTPDDINHDLPSRKVKGIEYWFHFACYDPDFDLAEATKIVIHPMFNEYLHLKINKHIIVG